VLSSVSCVGSSDCTAVGDSTNVGGYAAESLVEASTAALAPTSTSLRATPSPSSFGQPITVTASVTPNDGNGSVSFSADGHPVSGCGNEALSAGSGTHSAKCAIKSLAVGTHSLTAAYSGDPDYLRSTSPPLSIKVNKAATATFLAASANPARVGWVNYTAAVRPIPDRGTVTFFDGLSPIRGCIGRPVSLTTGKLTCRTSYSRAGTHLITARYSGDTSYKASISPTLRERIT
jgi:hypothetical protein